MANSKQRAPPPRRRQRPAALLAALIIGGASPGDLFAEANPKSRPYVAYMTHPFDQEIVTKRILKDGDEVRGGGGRRVLSRRFAIIY